jgi:hypothetical protein
MDIEKHVGIENYGQNGDCTVLTSAYTMSYSIKTHNNLSENVAICNTNM